jgi:hypothetical protein
VFSIEDDIRHNFLEEYNNFLSRHIKNIFGDPGHSGTLRETFQRRITDEWFFAGHALGHKQSFFF